MNPFTETTATTAEKENRPHGSRRGAGAMVGGLAGFMIGSIVSVFLNSLVWMAPIAAVGIILGSIIGKSVLPKR